MKHQSNRHMSRARLWGRLLQRKFYTEHNSSEGVEKYASSASSRHTGGRATPTGCHVHITG